MNKSAEKESIEVKYKQEIRLCKFSTKEPLAKKACIQLLKKSQKMIPDDDSIFSVELLEEIFASKYISIDTKKDTVKHIGLIITEDIFKILTDRDVPCHEIRQLIEIMLNELVKIDKK
ncbi:MAG: hypothetical protein PHP50_12950 [Lachnospiraceae bacterium]|nr:hypothetical protein [Lachnospiraceae bacterium]